MGRNDGLPPRGKGFGATFRVAEATPLACSTCLESLHEVEAGVEENEPSLNIATNVPVRII